MNAATPLVRYDAMVSAIVACHSVDEIKEIRDKAMALEMYARVAKNTDAERKASDIRLRAERRTGELLKDLSREQGKRNDKATSPNDATKSEYAAALESSGLSRQTASRYQELAGVPQPLFEEALRDPVRKPSTNRILQAARDPEPAIDDKSLWIWGRARDFEREGFANRSPFQLLAGMTETMKADMVRIVPDMLDFFKQFQEAIDNESA